MGCNLRDLVEAEDIEISQLVGQRVGVDAFLVAFQFLTSIRATGPEGDGGPLRNADGHIVAHLMGFLARTTMLLEAGVQPIYVFDGEHPELKADVMAQRRQRNVDATARWKAALAEGDFLAAQKHARGAVRYTGDLIEETQRLLDLLGVRWITAAAEGEAQAAVMAQRGELDVVATQDWDALLYGSPVLVRNLMSAGSRRRGRVIRAQRIDLEPNLQRLGISREQLVDLAIMVGTDFHPGIRGIGPKTGLKLIIAHGDIEGVARFKEFGIPERLDEIRRLFLDHPACPADGLAPGVIDEEGLRAFLITERGFSEDRLDRNLNRIREHVRRAGQSSLGDFI